MHSLSSFVRRHRTFIGGFFQIIFILIFTCCFAQSYLNLDAELVPYGREFLTEIQANYFWRNLATCGECAFWWGNSEGGYPALVELTSCFLHPIVAIATFAFGVVNGVKIAAVICLFLGGIGIWRLARILNCSPYVAVWCACLAVCGGHVASRMHQGSVGLILSFSSAALSVPALILAIEKGGWARFVVAGLFLGLLVISGGGYLQIGFLFTGPAFLFLLRGSWSKLISTVRGLAITGLVTLMIGAARIFPYIAATRFFYKDGAQSDPIAQSVPHILLNLLIDNYEFYNTTLLNKLPFIAMYSIYLGWIPVIFCIWGVYVGVVQYPSRRVFALLTFLILLLAYCSGGIHASLGAFLPSPILGFLRSARYLAYITSLLAIPVLAFAAIGASIMLEKSLAKVRASSIPAYQRWISLVLIWLLFLGAFCSSVASAWSYNRGFLSVIRRVPTEAEKLASALAQNDVQWVGGRCCTDFSLFSAELNLKTAFTGYRTWRWKGGFPSPSIGFTSNQTDWANSPRIRELDGVSVVQIKDPPTPFYAQIEHPDKSVTKCTAYGLGGDITVQCDAAAAGELKVMEHNAPGWKAELDGEALQLLEGDWLRMQFPSGRKELHLRYRAWLGPTSLASTYVGLLVGLIALLALCRSRVVREEVND